MSRVMLFVQFRNKRPTVAIGQPKTLRLVNGEWSFSAAQSDMRDRANRWWLVECENADSGRLLILRSQRVGGPDAWTAAVDEHTPTPPGRILASGGRGAAEREDRK